MIVGCYSLHLYCDHPDHNRDYRNKNHIIDSLDAEFTGETYQDCAKQAKARGWVLSRDRQTAICSVHARAVIYSTQ